MTDEDKRRSVAVPVADDRLRLAEIATAIGAFEVDLGSGRWVWTPQVAVLFGVDPGTASAEFEKWQRAIFADHVPKVPPALEAAKESGRYYVEFRTKDAGGMLRWRAGKGEVSSSGDGKLLRGTYYDIS